MIMSMFEISPFEGNTASIDSPPLVGDSVDISVLSSFEDAQLEGEPDLIVELIDLYQTEGARLVGAIKQALSDRDKAAIKRAAHSLRGSSSNLGILQMTLICEQMEESECSDSFPCLEELVRSLELEFEKVAKILSAERQRRTS